MNGSSRDRFPGDQDSESLSLEQVREIAREEAANALAALKEQVGNIGRRADGNINGSDFIEAVEFAERQVRPIKD